MRLFVYLFIYLFKLNTELLNICVAEQRTTALQIGNIISTYSTDKALQTL